MYATVPNTGSVVAATTCILPRLPADLDVDGGARPRVNLARCFAPEHDLVVGLRRRNRPLSIFGARCSLSSSMPIAGTTRFLILTWPTVNPLTLSTGVVPARTCGASGPITAAKRLPIATSQFQPYRCGEVTKRSRFTANPTVAVTTAITMTRLASALRTGVADRPRPGCRARRVPTTAGTPKPARADASATAATDARGLRRRLGPAVPVARATRTSDGIATRARRRPSPRKPDAGGRPIDREPTVGLGAAGGADSGEG